MLAVEEKCGLGISVFHSMFPRNTILAETWNVLGCNAAVANPKRGDVTTPITLVRFV
jgi:hypothetical protein